MKKRTEERRLKLLQLEGSGVDKPTIIKTLMKTFSVSRQTVWLDYKSKPVWQDGLLDMKNAIQKIVNRFEQLYARASLLYHGTEANPSTPKQKTTALYLMKAINAEMFRVLCPQGATTIIQANIEQTKTVEVLNIEGLDSEAIFATVQNLMEEESRRLRPTSANPIQSSENST